MRCSDMPRYQSDTVASWRKTPTPSPGDPLADHHRAINIHPVNLEYRLRNIETNRANFAHGRLPSKWFASTQPPYGTPMPQSGRRPQHHLRPIDNLCVMSAFAPIGTKLLNYSNGRNGPQSDKRPDKAARHLRSHYSSTRAMHGGLRDERGHPLRPPKKKSPSLGLGGLGLGLPTSWWNATLH